MRKTDSLSAESLVTTLTTLGANPAQHHFILAYSGGVDSHVLLHLAVRAKLALTIVHINHGISPQADVWQQHCQQVCDDLGVALQVEKVQVTKSAGSLEASARKARYELLSRYVENPDTVLLTAHHQDDQAETVLLRLLRGSGVHGWAGMRPARPFAAGLLLRPLLSYSRQQLLDHARHAGLGWIEDESNVDTSHDRNYLRHEILPLLEKRWPQAASRLAMVATDAREAADLLDQVAEMDLLACRHAEDGLELPMLQQFDRQHQALLLRLWLRENGFAMPSRAKLDEILVLIRSQPDSAKAVCRWADTEAWRYRQQLVVRTRLPEVAADWRSDWAGFPGPLLLPELALELNADSATGAGLSAAAIQGKRLSLSLRRGGERVKLPGRAHHHMLKKLYQEAGVPPWLRQRLPLVFVDDELAAVAGLWVFAPFVCKKGEPGYRITATETSKTGSWHNAVV